MNRKFLNTVVALTLLVVAGSVSSAYAASYTFNYNTVAAGATNGAIQTYMQSVVGGAATVALSGAKEANGYNGDGHVIGTCVSGVCTSKTLGNDDAGTDRFLITLQSGSIDTIKMQFTGLQLYSVTFDYEIFPDATCTSGPAGSASCPNKPDFTLLAGSGGTTSTIFHDYGDFPAAGSHSPVSGASANETSAQKIVKQYTYSSSTAFDTIWFQDWPATIGVDNVTISTNRPPVPEPASILLFGSGLVGLIRRRKAK